MFVKMYQKYILLYNYYTNLSEFRNDGDCIENTSTILLYFRFGSEKSEK